MKVVKTTLTSFRKMMISNAGIDLSGIRILTECLFFSYWSGDQLNLSLRSLLRHVLQFSHLAGGLLDQHQWLFCAFWHGCKHFDEEAR